MTVRIDGGTIALQGNCHLEDAVTLLELMTGYPDLPIDLHECTRAHMAVVQVLLASRPAVRRPSSDPFLKAWLIQLLEAPEQ